MADSVRVDDARAVPHPGDFLPGVVLGDAVLLEAEGLPEGLTEGPRAVQHDAVQGGSRGGLRVGEGVDDDPDLADAANLAGEGHDARGVVRGLREVAVEEEVNLVVGAFRTS